MNPPITFQTVLCASKDQVSSEIGGEAVILNLQSGTYYGLDEVGNRIWELIQTPRSVKEVQETILGEYEVESDQCEKDLIALLQLLADENLIEIERENATAI
jgi:hypothetical protein